MPSPCPSCGYDPPMPPGYVPLTDGEVTPLMQTFAHTVAFDGRTAYGDEFDRQFMLKDGTQGLITARVEHHSYSTDAQGNTICGCFKGVTMYHSPLRSPDHPADPGQPNPVPDNGSSSVTKSNESILGYVSLAIVVFSSVFGIAHTVFTHRKRST